MLSQSQKGTEKRSRRNRSPYPEKGLVAGLQSAGEKLAVVASTAMQEDELSDDALSSLRELVAQASDFLTRIENQHKDEPATSTRRIRAQLSN